MKLFSKQNFLNLLTSFALSVGALFVSAPALAQNAVDQAKADQVKVAVEAWLNNRFKVDSVRATPMPSIYEVRIGFDLLYVDSSGQFAFVNEQMIDIKANRNLTQARMDEIMRVNWNDLPLDIALKQVNGNGKRRVAVFEDPNCPHCRTTRTILNNTKDVTIYTFTYPILTSDSELRVKQALCAKDKMKAWNDLVLSRTIPANDGSCKNDLAQVVELGRKLRVTGTPTLIFSDGKRVPSGVSKEQFETLLATHSKS